MRARALAHIHEIDVDAGVRVNVCDESERVSGPSFADEFAQDRRWILRDLLTSKCGLVGRKRWSSGCKNVVVLEARGLLSGLRLVLRSVGGTMPVVVTICQGRSSSKMSTPALRQI